MMVLSLHLLALRGFIGLLLKNPNIYQKNNFSLSAETGKET
jgi:hypothetical protein